MSVKPSSKLALLTEEGPIEDVNRIVNLLRKCWDDIRMPNLQFLPSDMLDRIENPVSEPPFLRFDIKRTFINGTSLWEKVQRWTINLEEMKASCEMIGHRKVREAIPVAQVAEEVAEKILAGEPDQRYDIEVKIRIHSDEVNLDSRVAKEPRERRKKRFYEELDRLLENEGFERGLFIYHNQV